MARAESWFHVGRGTFHPATAIATARWRRAATEGAVPRDDELAALAASMCGLPFVVVDGVVHRTGACDDVDLNVVAKGHIVDLAAATGAAVPGVAAVTVNAGGDLLHRVRAR